MLSFVQQMAPVLCSNYHGEVDTFVLLGTESDNDKPDLLTLHCETAQARLLIPVSSTVWLVLKGHDTFKLCPVSGSGSRGWGWGS